MKSKADNGTLFSLSRRYGIAGIQILLHAKGFALAVTLLFILGSFNDVAGAVKTWVGGSAAWTNSGSWSPSGAPGTYDELVFNTGTTITVTAVPDITIYTLKVSNNTNVTLSAAGSSARTITFANGVTGNDLVVENGSTLTLADGSTSDMSTSFVASGLTGLISGTFSIGGNGNNFRLDATLTVAVGGVINIDGSLRVKTVGSLIVNGTINNNGELSNGTVTGDASTVTVNAGGIIINNATYQVVATTSPAKTLVYGSFNAKGQAVGGTGTFTMMPGGTLISANTNGVDGSLPNTNHTCETGVNYEFDLAGNQATGTKMNADVKNLTFSGSGTKTWSKATTVNGNLLINSGVTLNGGTSLTHNLKGNWTNNGFFTYTTASTINLNGTAQQNIAGSSPTTFNNLTVNNSTGVLLSGSVSVTVSGTFTLTSGILSTNANYLIVSGTASDAISGGSSSSYINGNLRRGIATGPNTYAYPIGTANVYAPVSIAFSSVSTAGSLNGSTTDGDNGNIGSSTFDPNKTVNRNWDFSVQSDLGTYGYSATFNWVSIDQDAGFNSTIAYVGKYSGSSWSYPTVGTRASTSIQITGATSFSSFQVGSGCPEVTATVGENDKQNVSCYAGNNGSITITASGGTAPYKFSLYNGATGTYVETDDNPYTFTGLTAGEYHPRVKDANDCESPSCEEEILNVEC